jgi:serine/threonine-protein kinase
VVSAVSAAHELGVVHRDLKPDNIFLVACAPQDLNVKVLDFGIAKIRCAVDTADAAEILAADDTATGTGQGAILGTPCYMAPEQVQGEHAGDHRVDTWALGLILRECLTGVRAIGGPQIRHVIHQLATTGIAPLRAVAPHVPVPLCELIDCMTSSDRDARPSLEAVVEILRRYTVVAEITREKASRVRLATVSAGIALAVVAAAIGYWWPRPQVLSSISASSTRPTQIVAEASSLQPMAATSDVAAVSTRPLPETAAASATEVSRDLKLPKRRPTRRMAPRPAAVAPPKDLEPASSFRGGLAEDVPF